ncbi:transcriptional regulator NosR [Marinobacterium arenosum]|uniref:transcriptional regulator NosR n=1 Tax=Marinobacterium arenosum TaxID=2862496 RepID=UPI001C972439|nr:NosR/NirI family protein [Marinobacterium arenosum]MBY4674988.1 NosR/NirI family protein [Marinobacterium arenosum]
MISFVVGRLLTVVLLLLLGLSNSFAMVPVPESSQLEALRQAFPDADRIGEKAPVGDSEMLVRQLFDGEELIGYAFESDDVVDIAAYSGKPINMLVAFDTEGNFRHSQVLEHHEPILLVGIPEQKLFDFADQYRQLKITDKVRVGAANSEDVISVDAVSGATVTVMVVNETIMRAARKVAMELGIAGLSKTAKTPPATVKTDLHRQASWSELTGDGSIRRLYLTRGDIDEAFKGTAAEGPGHGEQKRQQPFIELYYAPVNIPTIGRNLLGDSQYNWLMGEIKPGDQVIAVMGEGRYSFKGNGYVRGGIFDRTQLRQDGKVISFHDTDYYRLDDVFIDGFPGFMEMALFIVRNQYEFDLGKPWQLELLVRRQVGALDSVFTSFFGDYSTPEQYIERPQPVVAEPEAEPEPLWVSVWRDRAFQIGVLSVSLVLLTAVIFLQDWAVRYPKYLHLFRRLFLVYTVVFIGWYTLGQLSIVNVFTFVHALMGRFQWEVFLLDPMLFILWGFVAMTLLLWGRGIFCGWLCPFGALQELINELARKLKIKQFEPPFGLHERLWAVKYIILLVLFAISLESLSEAERYAEVEPFKTAIMLKFQREWGYVLYAGGLLFVSIFTRKVYCRYFCPLGAALAIPAKIRLFDWLKRRKECGQPCRICANECEIQAIHPDGKINANECHYCLDCQMTYYNHDKCPPLVQKKRKALKQAEAKRIPTVDVSEPVS